VRGVDKPYVHVAASVWVEGAHVVLWLLRGSDFATVVLAVIMTWNPSVQRLVCSAQRGEGKLGGQPCW
jgi:hypothetical protein